MDRHHRFSRDDAWRVASTSTCTLDAGLELRSERAYGLALSENQEERVVLIVDIVMRP